jgi:glycosidase
MLDINGVFHEGRTPWQYVGPGRALRLVVRAPKGTVLQAVCYSCDPCDTVRGSQGENLPRLCEEELALAYRDLGHDYFLLRKGMATHKLRYHFLLHTTEGVYALDERGVTRRWDEGEVRPFFVSFVFDGDASAPPAWADGMTWYQIFPDRFWTGDPAHQARWARWATGPVRDPGFRCGGDFAGIEEKIPYLQQAGATGVYLNPVFLAESVHRYDTVDYYALDPPLGSEEDFIRLCRKLHQGGFRVMLDGVFNHASWKGPQFLDVLAKKKASPYYDWFLVTDPEGLDRVHPSAPEGMTGPLPYSTFAFAPSMPKWNTKNPAVAEFLIGAAEYWTRRCHIDAWRLDVPDETHGSFLRQFKARMKALRPDIYIVGEIWSDPSKWLQEGLFDGVMNYPLYFAVRDFFFLKAIDAPEFCGRVTRHLAMTPEARGMFNFCGTHDVPRALWLAGGQPWAVAAGYAMTALFPGGLSLYYGDEAGLTGGYDPDNRRCMPWGQAAPPVDLSLALALRRRFAGRGPQSVRPLDGDTVEVVMDGPEGETVRISRKEGVC